MKHNICGIVADVEIVELVPIESKVLLHAADVRIADICLVYIPPLAN